MSQLNVYLDTHLCILRATGVVYNNYNEFGIDITSVSSDNSSINEDLLKEFKCVVIKIITEYCEDMEHYGNMKGNLLDFVTNNNSINDFFLYLNNYISKK